MTMQHHPNVKVVRVEGEAAAATSHHDKEKITVAIDAELLECGVCFGPLTPPLFQCTKGHISCSECCTDGALDYDCLMCREPETATRCRVMERILDGLSVPCAFRQHGCAEMVPYADKQDHVASCIHAPCHCPIAGCAGYTGASLRYHIKVDHPAVQSTLVRLGCLTALRMRGGEPARVACLGNGRTEFLLVVGQDVPSGRTLSVLHLMDEPSDDEDFKYKIEVVGEAGVLSLSGQAEGVERLAKPYQASAFLFVPNAIWDSSPEDVPVFIELK
ncbi:E3 ubiquitin-protein ligase SINA-like 7 [Phragmites australis]|uniref:E3 ubiquitin-protein ligase SINA-like 7 n=1 Tax=Phragmites australis TaxID=29695 RepID=UPI002D77A2DE|nr:E3 ubiquitin-protein ligase SINA-like 7 [Phragmites australis]